MISGRLRDIITIKRPVTALNKSGENIPSWTDYLTDVPAGVRTPSGREYEQADQVKATITHNVTIRYNSGITPDMRIYWGNMVLEIVFIIADRTNARYQIMKCTEVIE